ncbi:MAG: acetolactate decarboxylase [Elusimicrobia bacterium]|nr:acetolactate decarboxylase [Elusimicrobiota bacterium]
MKKYFLFLGMLFLLCISAQYLIGEENKNVLFQNSTLNALMAGNYDGTISCDELASKGDFGVGTFNQLDGEMVLLEGVFYKIGADGKIAEVEKSEKSPFATLTFFKSNKSFKAKKEMGLRQLQRYINNNIPTKNIIYALKIEGTFEYIKVRSVPKQEKPYKKLSEITKKEPVFEFSKIKGFLIGFRFPEFMDGINFPGYHFHFISDDKKVGGHLLDVALREAKIEIENINDFQLEFPQSKEFYRLDLTKTSESKEEKK